MTQTQTHTQTQTQTPVVVLSQTIMDGQVLRWFLSEDHWEAMEPVISVSRNRVSVHADDYQDLPRPWLERAMQAHHVLKRDPSADIAWFTTHFTRGLGGRLEPLPKEEER